MPNDLSPVVNAGALPRGVLSVTRRRHITPNMIRVTLTAPQLAEINADLAGAHCKIMLPEPGWTPAVLAQRLRDGPKPVTRTYTIRHARPDLCEIDIDFVDHGDDGPASAWAGNAEPGDLLGLGGYGKPKLTEFNADYYLVAADMSALPVATAALEAMPRDASGLAIFEITSEADRQEIDAPEGVEQRWLIHNDPHEASTAQIDVIREMPMPIGRLKTLIAGETDVVRELRMLLRGERKVPRLDVYASGYWRIGLAEDEHQKTKRAVNEADEAKLAAM